MKNYLLRKAFLYKLTRTFILSASVKIGYWTLKFLRDAYEQCSEVFYEWVDNILKNTFDWLFKGIKKKNLVGCKIILNTAMYLLRK